ncbi:ABC transporter permease [Microbacterium nanhaiense]|uniref:ABC transporter permease n=2 Tax=Microbacterium nanhaiense TaxID=1301026 RepID=A0ABQ2N5Z4_9MICO|nr:ABC transporter permease [Microbacterium nanhaiense]
MQMTSEVVSQQAVNERTKARRAVSTAHPSFRWIRVVALAVVLACYAFFVPVILPVDLSHVDYVTGAVPPSLEHLFGTDLAGRDLFLRAAHGLRITLLLALAGAFGALALGTLVGASFAFIGGRFDRIGMRVVDALNAVPHLLLGIVLAAFLRGSFLVVAIVVALTHWMQTTRLVRAELLAFLGTDQNRAAVSLGLTRWQILRFHAGPQLFSQLAIAFVLLVPHAVWHESTLTFLGLGLAPHEPSLGTLIELGQQALVSGAWWTLVVPIGLLGLVTLIVAELLGTKGRHRHV